MFSHARFVGDLVNKAEKYQLAWLRRLTKISIPLDRKFGLTKQGNAGSYRPKFSYQMFDITGFSWITSTFGQSRIAVKCIAASAALLSEIILRGHCVHHFHHKLHLFRRCDVRIAKPRSVLKALAGLRHEVSGKR